MRLKSVLMSLVLAFNECLGKFSYTASKCCPEEYSLNTRRECVPSTHHWYYMNVTVTGLPNCRFTVEFAEEGVTAYCFDNSFETDSYLMVKCEGKGRTGRRVPPMNYIRKCCPFNRSYDTSWQSCWGPESREMSWPRAFFNIFVSRSRGGVDVNFGLEMCNDKQVLVDFVLHYTQVLRDESEAIVLTIPGRHEMRFNPDEVCLDLTEALETVVIRACVLAEGICCPKGHCDKKCCPDGFIAAEGKCVKRNVELSKLDFVHSPNNLASDHIEPDYTIGSLCSFNSSLSIDGEHYNHNFCFDHLEKVNTCYVTCFDVKKFTNNSVCTKTWHYIVFSTSLTSCVSLFLAILLYCCILNSKNIHSTTICFYLISLLIGFTSLTISRGINNANVYHNFVKIIGYGYCFGNFCAFLWLLAASFSIWMAFGTTTTKKKPTILIYVAWIFSAIYAFIIMAGHFGFIPAVLWNIIEQEYYLNKSMEQIFYIIIPKSIILGCGFIVIMKAALKSKLAKNSSIFEGKQHQANKEKLKITFKLLAMQFANILLELILYNVEPGTKIWCILVIINSLQGLVIFLILLSKSFFKSMIVKCKKCMCCMKSSKVSPKAVFTT